MSPTIELRVDSVAFDKPSLLLYAQISQSFRIWIIPFYNAHVSLVTVLQLVQDKKTSRYLITSQNDLYQVNEFVKFFWFGGWLVVGLWQILAAGVCAVAALVLWPLTWVEENWAREGWRGIGQG
ncbi:hypothetical protein EG328_000385 [Venturia inaequalis]|uniref:SigF-like NTF2-like domain-containing protein n=1 Tax=Venturia inaequalis TaxID=5025 RepID=A0A8H3V2J8_VENIN|nr:hypothetical protein EG328_000385 [Venturia inaequalis]